MKAEEKKLFDEMIAAGRALQVAEIEYIIAKNDYKAAMDAYKAEIATQKN